MEKYQGNLQHYIVIQTDYENERKIFISLIYNDLLKNSCFGIILV